VREKMIARRANRAEESMGKGIQKRGQGLFSALCFAFLLQPVVALAEVRGLDR
jgi:hypothetical protein